jgi:hypothetical protein
MDSWNDALVKESCNILNTSRKEFNKKKVISSKYVKKRVSELRNVVLESGKE